MTNDETTSAANKYLKSNNFKNIEVIPKNNTGKTGPDITAKKGRKTYYIEVIGYKGKGPARSIDFNKAFVQAISRFNGKANQVLVIAMPDEYLKGLNQRIKAWGGAWKRIGDAFPRLQLWFFDKKTLTKDGQWNSFQTVDFTKTSKK